MQFDMPPHDHSEALLEIQPLVLSVDGTARALGIGRSSVYLLLRRGQLDAIKVGRRTLITTASVERLVCERMARPVRKG